MMKFSVLSFLTLVAIFHGSALTAEGNDLNFDLAGASTKSYGDFISNLRRALPFSERLYNIPLLLSSLSGRQSYILVHLTNYAGQTITAAIDVTNVYIMGYRAGDAAYFFDEPSALEASKYVFTDAKRKTKLPYSGNYQRLESAAGKLRDNIYIGLPALDSAITTLYYYDQKSAPSAFLVLIQTTAEAARYKYIEQVVGKRVDRSFLPDLAVLSLENSWSALSKQIQIAKNNGGQFKSPVLITNPKGEKVEITNVNSAVVTSNIALLLNSKNIAAIVDDDGLSVDV